MKGDFTRDTFDPLRHFSRVLMQQGRVQLDADFNEQASILLHYLRTMMTDLIGPYGGPAFVLGKDGAPIDNRGFKIGPISGNDFAIDPGRYYVDGFLCENVTEIKFSEQEYLHNLKSDAKNKLSPSNENKYIVYLDVWERHVTCVQEDIIQEKALGGPDTCGRAQVVWQVRVKASDDASASQKKKLEQKMKDLRAKLKTASDAKKEEINSRIEELKKQIDSLGKTTAHPSCSEAREWLRRLPKLGNAKMKAQIKPNDAKADECNLPPEARYRGAENQLYRIEIHRSGSAWDSKGEFKNSATFKWSRDNGSVVFPIIRQTGETVILQTLGRDERTTLKAGDFVEIIDDDQELRGEPGMMAEVVTVTLDKMAVTLKPPADVSFAEWPQYDEESTNHPLLRRWDQRPKKDIKMSDGAILITEGSDSNSGWIEIEDGIEVQFQPEPDGQEGSYRTGDYWLIPARVATGNIEWPASPGEKGNESSKALSPHGIVHHYAPLALMVKGKPTDCRCFFRAPCE